MVILLNLPITFDDSSYGVPKNGSIGVNPYIGLLSFVNHSLLIRLESRPLITKINLMVWHLSAALSVDKSNLDAETAIVPQIIIYNESSKALLRIT